MISKISIMLYLRTFSNITTRVLRIFFSKIVTFRRIYLTIFYYFLSLISWKRGVFNHKRKVPVIVSLASIPSRINVVNVAIETLLRQNLKPNRLILWLPDSMNYENIPFLLKLQTKRGLEIQFCEEIGPYKKFYYTLQRYPDAIIVTADDDLFYPRYWLQELYKAYQVDPNNIYGHRLHRITMTENNVNAYLEWHWEISFSRKPSYMNFCTGVGGVLYPPNSLPKETLRKEVFQKLAPKADDVWLKAMTVLTNYPHVKVDNVLPMLYVCNTQRQSLYQYNKKYNDTQIKAVFEHYDIVDKMINAEKTLQSKNN